MRSSPRSGDAPERNPQREDSCGLRCLCGSLLARLVDDHVELKCKRCKRMMMVPLSGMPRSSRQSAKPHHDTE